MKNSKVTMVIIIIIVLLLLFFLYKNLGVADTAPTADYTSVPFDQWREFSSEEGNFKILVPSIPQHASETTPSEVSEEKRKYDIYVAKKGNEEIFMITLITHPEGQIIDSPEKLFQHVIDELMATSPNNELKEVSPGKHQEHQALTFSIHGDQVNIDSKTFIVDHRLYVLSYMADVGYYHPESFKHFVDSFQLLEQKPAENK